MQLHDEIASIIFIFSFETLLTVSLTSCDCVNQMSPSSSAAGEMLSRPPNLVIGARGESEVALVELREVEDSRHPVITVNTQASRPSLSTTKGLDARSRGEFRDAKQTRPAPILLFGNC